MRHSASLIGLGIVWAGLASAAPCCGGGAALPSLITADDRTQFSVSSSIAKVIGDAPVSGLPVFRSDSDNEVTQTWNLRAATLLSDRWQIGVSLPLVQHTRSGLGQSGYGVGDVASTLAFEALPEWSYSLLVPKIFTFAQLTLPTGSSIYDQETLARGRGFYQTAFGFAALKAHRRWDFSLQGNFSKSFRRHVAGADPYTVDPTLGALVSMAVGYSPGKGDWRFGVSGGPVFEGPLRVHSASENSRSASQLVWNAAASVGYLIGERWNLDLSYSDQTLFGSATNVALSRGIALNVLYRTPR